MCHGHPKLHPCSHTSVVWHFCPSARIDLDTGSSPCQNQSFAAAQDSKGSCPLVNCSFRAKGPSWMCCSCHQGPNTMGWCTMQTSQLTMNPETCEYEPRPMTCGHGCCKKCNEISDPSPSPELPLPELEVPVLPVPKLPAPEASVPDFRKGGSGRSHNFSVPSSTRSRRRHTDFSIRAAMAGLADGGESSVGSHRVSSSKGKGISKHDLEFGKRKHSSKKQRSKSY